MVVKNINKLREMYYHLDLAMECLTRGVILEDIDIVSHASLYNKVSTCFKELKKVLPEKEVVQ
jgi:hypothetical protein